MSSIQHLRELIGEQLTVAAVAIFTEIEKIIIQYEEEINRQRRLLDITWNPQIKLHRIDLSQQHVHQEEEVLTDQPLRDQGTNSSLDQEESEEVKEEQEEVCTSQEGEEIALKQETDNSTLDSTFQESYCSEAEPDTNQLSSHDSPLPENQDQEANNQVDLETTVEMEMSPEKKHKRKRRDDGGKMLRNGKIREQDDRKKSALKQNVCQTSKKGLTKKKEKWSHGRIHKDLPLQHVHQEEEVLADEQLCDRESKSILDQDEFPGFEQQEELCTSQEGEQLVLKQVTNNSLLVSTFQETDFSEAEPKTDQLSSRNSPLPENQDQEGNKDMDSTRDVEMKPKRRSERIRSHSNEEDNAPVSGSPFNSKASETDLKCNVSGKTFGNETDTEQHDGINTGMKPNTDLTPKKQLTKREKRTCEKGRKCYSKHHLFSHMRAKTRKRPCSCKMCVKCFSENTDSSRHKKSHKSAKCDPCESCGKSLAGSAHLSQDKRIHGVDELYFCDTCGKTYIQYGGLLNYRSIHTGNHSCYACGKSFSMTCNQVTHMRNHTAERPYSCEMYGNSFCSSGAFHSHMSVHND